VDRFEEIFFVRNRESFAVVVVVVVCELGRRLGDVATGGTVRTGFGRLAVLR